MKQHTVKRTDTSGNRQGRCQVSVEMMLDEKRPCLIIYDHSQDGLGEYWSTGKTGERFDCGTLVHEMETASGARLWLSDGLLQVWED